MENAIKRAEEMLLKKLNTDHVDPERELRSLGLDSLDVVELCLDFEDEFGVAFSSDDLKSLKKVSDLYNAIELKVKK